ncbi:FecR/PupR family sigma factor regulator [Sphingomonas sp. Ant H11]|uniref:FecR/PupR family sigma factor regulator n=1 Tax=Sphingomonas sp. Ant H11 TaxID=1564113 RepID=UPI000ABBF2F5|nr:FecR/PupR family sigma factor regulator [Sphingomonas sp. Ant H11]
MCIVYPMKGTLIVAVEDATIVDRAIDWHLRQGDMGEADWRAFVAWLEEDPAHAQAFDTVALDMAMLSERADLFSRATHGGSASRGAATDSTSLGVGWRRGSGCGRSQCYADGGTDRVRQCERRLCC